RGQPVRANGRGAVRFEQQRSAAVSQPSSSGNREAAIRADGPSAPRPALDKMTSRPDISVVTETTVTKNRKASYDINRLDSPCVSPYQHRPHRLGGANVASEWPCL